MIQQALSAVPLITLPPKYLEERIMVRITAHGHLPERVPEDAA